jgi:hypothetical protein
MAQANPLQLQRAMQGVLFPADKNALLQNARDLDAEEDVVESFERLPEQEFRAPADVIFAVGSLSSRPD